MKYIVLILGIWFFATIGAIATKDSDCISYAFLITLLIGFGYLIL